MRILLAAAFAALAACGDGEAGLNRSIEAKALAQSLAAYRAAAAAGDAKAACTAAGAVRIAVAAAGDRARAERWRTIERDDCAAAGIPIVPDE